MKNFAFLEDVIFSEEVPFCQSCVIGKQHKNPHSRSINVTKKPFELVHSDLCRVQTTSYNGFKYTSIFLDDYTSFLTVYLLKTKDQIF